MQLSYARPVTSEPISLHQAAYGRLKTDASVASECAGECDMLGINECHWLFAYMHIRGMWHATHQHSVDPYYAFFDHGGSIGCLHWTACAACADIDRRTVNICLQM